MAKIVFPTPTTVPEGINNPFNTKGTSSMETKALIIEMANLQATFNQKGVNFGHGDRVDGNYEDGQGNNDVKLKTSWKIGLGTQVSSNNPGREFQPRTTMGGKTFLSS